MLSVPSFVMVSDVEPEAENEADGNTVTVGDPVPSKLVESEVDSVHVSVRVRVSVSDDVPRSEIVAVTLSVSVNEADSVSLEVSVFSRDGLCEREISFVKEIVVCETEKLS